MRVGGIAFVMSLNLFNPFKRQIKRFFSVDLCYSCETFKYLIGIFIDKKIDGSLLYNKNEGQQSENCWDYVTVRED